MKRSYIGLALGVLVAVGAALSLPSCGHDQKLVSLDGSSPALLLLFRCRIRDTDRTVQRDRHLHPSSGDERRHQSGDLEIDDRVVTINYGGGLRDARTAGVCGVGGYLSNCS